jgi:hypothetical protein
MCGEALRVGRACEDEAAKADEEWKGSPWFIV